MQDRKLHGRILAALRKLTFSYKPRQSAKQKQKLAPATYRCQSCKFAIYEGAKELKATGLRTKFPQLKKGKIHMDHVEPVIPVNGFPNKTWSWDIYISRLFCLEEGWQVLCSSCHDEKTTYENIQRNLRRKSVKSS